MSLLEVSVGLIAASLVGAASLFLIATENAMLREQIAVSAAFQKEWNLRALLSNTAGSASMVRVYSDATAARENAPAGIALSGVAVRMDFSGGLASGNGGDWAATLEIVDDLTTPEAGDLAIEYQNIDQGNLRSRWRVAGQLRNPVFAIRDGILFTEAEIAQRQARVLTCIR